MVDICLPSDIVSVYIRIPAQISGLKIVPETDMRKKKLNLERHYNKWGYIFMIPFAAAFLFFYFHPLANTVYFAFCHMRGMGTAEAQFLPSIGEPWYINFVEIFQAKTFAKAFKNTMTIWAAYAIPELIFTCWLAAMITDRRLKMKGRTIFKTGFFLPKLLEGTDMGFVLTNHFVATVGSTLFLLTAASAMNGFGFTEEDFKFFMSDRFFIIVLSIYSHFGISFIYIIAGITGVPVEVMEAAEIDGANRFQTFTRVTLPCMKPIVFFIAVISIIDGVGMYKVPSYIGNAYDVFMTNITLMQYLQNQFYGGGFAYDKTSAASLIMLALYSFFAGVIYLIFIKDWDEAKQNRLIRKERREERRKLKAV